MSPPSILYKYRSLAGESFRYTQEVFAKKRLYLPTREQLNDPAEGAYRLKLKLSRSQDGIGYIAPESPLRYASARTLSLSANPKHPLMWTHYANSHCGICIGIRRSYLEQFGELQSVRYSKRVPKFLPNDTNRVKLGKPFLSKASDWEYEQEWRIIRSDGVRFFEFPIEAIATIILGYRLSNDDREWVMHWRNSSGCTATIKRASLSGHAAKMHLSSC